MIIVFAGVATGAFWYLLSTPTMEYYTVSELFTQTMPAGLSLTGKAYTITQMAEVGYSQMSWAGVIRTGGA